MAIITYDDDCSICTKFAKIIRYVVGRETKVVNMSNPMILEEGIARIGHLQYWKSFHVVKGNKWYSESEAITELMRLLPLGKLMGQVAEAYPVKKFLTLLLHAFQRKRKHECKI